MGNRQNKWQTTLKLVQKTFSPFLSSSFSFTELGESDHYGHMTHQQPLNTLTPPDVDSKGNSIWSSTWAMAHARAGWPRKHAPRHLRGPRGFWDKTSAWCSIRRCLLGVSCVFRMCRDNAFSPSLYPEPQCTLMTRHAADCLAEWKSGMILEALAIAKRSGNFGEKKSNFQEPRK